MPILDQLYQNHCMNSMIYTIRSESNWRYQLSFVDPKSLDRRIWRIIEDEQGKPCAYVKTAVWGSNVYVQELGTRTDISLRAIGLGLLKLLPKLTEEIEPKPEEQARQAVFSFGRHHAIYEALDPELGSLNKPYAWYIRIPDLPAFLKQITPVLEERLANSVMCNHSGKLRLNFYKSAIALQFEEGKIVEIGPHKMTHENDTDANFSDLQVIQLICGRRDVNELQHIHADCFAKNEAKVLLKILFPKWASQPNSLG